MRSIVMPAARTGRERSKSTAVIRTAHTNKGVWYCEIAGRFHVNNRGNKINST